MNQIGGYFELELRKGEEYHRGAIRLNTGRNALEYILHAKGYKKVFLPYYSCDVLLEPIMKLKINYDLYHINEQFEPIFDFNIISKHSTFIYINYFGINGHIVKKLSNICQNLIIDNSQAFFEKPLDGIDTFYSPRKFFGVPDGAYLYTDKYLSTKFTDDESFNRFSHLIKRIDKGADYGYKDFKSNEDSFKGQSIKSMSLLTKGILGNIDYNSIIEIRKRNFQFLHQNLKFINQYKFPEVFNFIPMVYPFLTFQSELKQSFIDNKIYLATYWPNVLKWCNKNQLEYKYTKYTLNLPIDQRYDELDMKNILNFIK
jgi:hypothetical protein